MHEISVIISNFNGAKWLPRLMETLREQRGVSLEIIVVDRNSTDGSAELLAGYPEVKVVSHPPETGLVCGYALGYRSATKDLLFFMNEDMWLEPECLRLVAEGIDLPGKVASAMPVQMTYDMQDLVNSGVWYKSAFWCPNNPYPFASSHSVLPTATRRTAQTNAGACMIHRVCYEQVGGWDISFFLDFEDTDLCLRLWQRGWHCVVVPSARLGHAVGASNGKALPNSRTTVSQKRYISGGVNKLAIAFKTFPTHLVLAALLGWLDGFLRNVVRCRFRNSLWDCAQLLCVLRLMPSFLAYREQAKLNAVQPASEYFKDSAHAPS